MTDLGGFSVFDRRMEAVFAAAACNPAGRVRLAKVTERPQLEAGLAGCFEEAAALVGVVVRAVSAWSVKAPVGGVQVRHGERVFRRSPSGRSGQSRPSLNPNSPFCLSAEKVNIGSLVQHVGSEAAASDY